jgi:hypothetical protein
MLTQSDYDRLGRILQADRLSDNAPLEGEEYEEKIAFALRIQKSIEVLVKHVSP